MAQVTECLLCKYKALSSKPSPIQKKKKRHDFDVLRKEVIILTLEVSTPLLLSNKAVLKTLKSLNSESGVFFSCTMTYYTADVLHERFVFKSYCALFEEKKKENFCQISKESSKKISKARI
jgi:hypothetical protein